MIELLVAADDRTGALETAGACAAAGLGPTMTVTAIDQLAGRSPAVDHLPGHHGAVVVDLASRHLSPAAAGARAAAIDEVVARRMAHKIDSLLRGGWAHELVARYRVGGRRVLIVAAAPALGRTCRGGVVFESGRAVSTGAAGRDARTPLRSSRPAEHLRWAGAAAVAPLGSVDEAAVWLARGTGLAVCDATTTTELDAIGVLWTAAHDVLLAGPAAVIGAAAGAVGARPLRSVSPAPAPALVPPVLVVAGSLHPAARRQVDVLAAAGAVVIEDPHPLHCLDVAARGLARGRPVVLTTSTPSALPVAPDDADGAAARLAEACRRVVAATDVATLVVLGGDTAAAVLGSEPLAVGGMVGPGTPWARRDDGLLVVTRAGGFGTANALVDLLDARLVP